MKRVQISVELFPPDSRVWRYDSWEDGPLNEWLSSTILGMGKPVGPDFNRMSHNATIRVSEVEQ